jgi:putative spermidine/putrescine transport system substrate-binding protein
MSRFTLTRRSMLMGAAAAGATLAAPSVLRAQTSRVIVGAWGGDYERLLKSAVDPKTQESGVDLVIDTGNATSRKTKMITALRIGGGAMDVSCLSNSDMHQMSTAGALKQVDELGLTRQDKIFPQFAKPYAIPHIYSAMTIIYDRSQVDTPPTSIKDLWTEEYLGKVGFSDILFNYYLVIAAATFGKNGNDFAAAKAAYEEYKEKSGGVRVYSSNEAIANAFNAKEIKATIMWKARAFQWRKAGLDLVAVAPSEGAVPVVFEAGCTSFATNVKGAGVTLDALLDPELQLKFAEAMGYLPTVSDAPIPEKMREDLGFTDAERENFILPDLDYIAKEQSETLAWWNQSFKA